MHTEVKFIPALRRIFAIKISPARHWLLRLSSLWSRLSCLAFLFEGFLPFISHTLPNTDSKIQPWMDGIDLVIWLEGPSTGKHS